MGEPLDKQHLNGKSHYVVTDTWMESYSNDKTHWAEKQHWNDKPHQKKKQY